MNFLLCSPDRIQETDLIIIEGKTIDMADNKVLEPDFNKKRFSIVIDVFENTQTIEIHSQPGIVVRYQEIIGALELMRMNMVINQSSKNIEEWIRWNKKQRPKKVKQTKV